MKRLDLEKYLGRNVEVTIFDCDTYTGILHRSGENAFKDDPNLYIPQNRYFLTDHKGACVSCLFRTSHVKVLKEIKQGYWLEKDKTFKCSECGYAFEHEGYLHYFNYCPCCGTKMNYE